MKILLAGGGTAGHIEPALAVARGLLSRYPQAVTEFVGTAQGLEQNLIPAAGFTLHNIPKVTISRRLSPSLLLVPVSLLRSIMASIKLVKNFDCLVGFGGYVSGPMYLAAALTRTPIVIHEQNAKPGWANRMGAHLTRFTAISYPVASGSLASAELTGLPLRSDVLAALASASGDWEQARRAAKHWISERFNLTENQPLIFIFGGSQGSQAINQVIESARKNGEFDNFSVIHGVGKNNELPTSEASYRALTYIDQMAELYLAADLIIARSGAVTCAEVSALGRYALFIPLPVGNGEQALNAQSLSNSGRAMILAQREFTPQWLRENLDSLMRKSAARPATADASGANAVDKIVAIIERAIKVK